MLFCIRQQTEKKFQETSKGDAIYAMHNIESTYNPTHNIIIINPVNPTCTKVKWIMGKLNQRNIIYSK